MKGWPGEPDMDYDVLVADGEAAANAGKPITDVIFDFGNVLIYWDPVAVLIPRYSQKTIDEFLDNDISGFYDVNDLMDGGTSTDEAIAIIRRDRGDKWADILDYYIKNFRDSLTGIVPGARVLVNDLKAAGIGVWGLSTGNPVCSTWPRNSAIFCSSLMASSSPVLSSCASRTRKSTRPR